MKLSVCIDAVMQGIPVAAALARLKGIGVEAFEFWSWWDKDMDAVRAAAKETGLVPAAMCTKMISLTDPAQRGEYLDGLRESVAVAKELGCRTLISQTGDDTGADRAAQHQSLVGGLREAAPILEEAGITLVVEPLNTYVDHKGYYLYSSAEGFAVIDEVDSPNVKLLYDIYHQQIMEGNIIDTVTANLDKIGHFHAAGVPGRHELNTGELNYRAIFDAVDAAGYDHYIGLEYFPLDKPETGILAYL